MHHSMATALHIPHILEEIVVPLTAYDLIVCAQVSKAWNALYEPFLWRTLWFTNRRIINLFSVISSSSSSSSSCSSAPSGTPQSGLHRNLHNVRSIKISFGRTFDNILSDTLLFPNLVRFEFKALETWSKFVSDQSLLPKMLRFLESNTSLQTVVLHAFPLDNDLYAKMLGAVLETHQGIQDLTIHGTYFTRFSSVLYILQGVFRSCSMRAFKLKTPRHIRAQSSSSSSMKHQSLPSDLLYFRDHQLLPATSLKQLWFDPNLADSEYFVALFALLKQNPHLERLCLTSRSSTANIYHSSLVSALGQHCPKLQHLELITITNDNNNNDNNSSSSDDNNNIIGNDTAADLLHSCSVHLRSLILRSSRLLHTLSGRSIQTLTHHQHSLTLERLKFESFIKIKSKHLQLLLTSCLNLTSFVVIYAQSRSMDPEWDQSRIHVKDLAVSGWTERLSPTFDYNRSSSGVGGGGRAWACRGLRELCVGFTGFTSLTSETAAQHHNDIIYNQLAALTELRILCLSSQPTHERSLRVDYLMNPQGVLDFSLKSGLKKLATLKHLRELNLNQVQDLRIREKETAWMMKHWRELTYIIVADQYPEMENEEYLSTVYVVGMSVVRPSITVSICV